VSRRPILVALLWMLLAGPAGAAAQQTRPAPPDEVARAVIRADSAGDWMTLLQLAHPEALIRFRALQIFQLRMLSRGDWPGMESLSTDSTTQARWQRARTRQQRYLLDSVFQVPTVDSLARTSPDTVFARLVRRQVADAADTTKPARVRPATLRVVGAVRASDTLAYVVVERTLEQPLGPMPEMFRDFPHETEHAELMVMRRLHRDWKSMLDGIGGELGFSGDLGTDE
jgi:hypothetical protein